MSTFLLVPTLYKYWLWARWTCRYISGGSGNVDLATMLTELRSLLYFQPKYICMFTEATKSIFFLLLLIMSHTRTFYTLRCLLHACGRYLLPVNVACRWISPGGHVLFVSIWRPVDQWADGLTSSVIIIISISVHVPVTCLSCLVTGGHKTPWERWYSEKAEMPWSSRPVQPEYGWLWPERPND